MTPITLDTDLISIKEVERATGFKKSYIYQKIKDGDFPRPKNWVHLRAGSAAT